MEDPILAVMRSAAAKRLPWMMVIGSLSTPSLGPAVAASRAACLEIERAGEYFPLDAVGLYNSWNTRVPMPTHVWANYFGSLLNLCDAVKVISNGAMATAVVNARKQFPGAHIIGAPTSSETAAQSRPDLDLCWHVQSGLKDPKPACYVAGPYSSDPSHCTARAFARAALLLQRYCPIVPFVAHDLDCAMPREYEHWLEFDAHLLRKARYFCRGIGLSRGADLEAQLAAELRIESIPEGEYRLAEREWLRVAVEILNRPPEDTKGL